MTAADLVQIHLITTTDTYPLRQAILRPGLPPAAAHFDGDDDPQACHFGAYARHVLVGIATLVPEPSPDDPELPAIRLRGMAVDDRYRVRGVGAALAAACLAEARRRDLGVVWCTARTPVERFWQKQGFETTSAPFDIPTAGPHVRMRCYL